MKQLWPYNTFQLNRSPKTVEKNRSKVRMFGVKITIITNFGHRGRTIRRTSPIYRIYSLPEADFYFQSSYRPAPYQSFLFSLFYLHLQHTHSLFILVYCLFCTQSQCRIENNSSKVQTFSCFFFWSPASIGYTDCASDGVGLGPWRRVGIVNPKHWSIHRDFSSGLTY